MRIVYCIDTISKIGGTERVTLVKANALSGIQGNDIYIIAAVHRNDNEMFILSSKVHFIDLRIPYASYKGNSWIKAMWWLYKCRKEHRKRLTSALNSISPDFVISTGGIEKLFLSTLKVKSNPFFIREIHFSKYYRRVIDKSLLGKICGRINEFIEYHFIFYKYDRYVVLTQEDFQDNWNCNSRVIVIPNPITLDGNGYSSLDNNVVISAGRLIESKNFKSLINIWKYVNESYPDWKLEIYGDGPMRYSLQKQIEDLGLNESVTLCGFTTDIESKMLNSSIFAFTSTNEGFGLVLLEAMSCGLPVVSYACPCGPKDIIEQGKNGFYVSLNDEHTFAEKLKLLIGNEKLRKEMGSKAVLRSRDFSLERIIDLWMKTFEELLKEKRNH